MQHLRTEDIEEMKKQRIYLPALKLYVFCMDQSALELVLALR